MLVKMWRKVHSLWVEMWIGAATRENSIEVLQKSKIELPAIRFLCVQPKKMETTN